MEKRASLEAENNSFPTFASKHHNVFNHEATAPVMVNDNNKNCSLPSSIAADEIRSTCKKILASHLFINAPRMRSLLNFLVEKAICASTHSINEYLIGVEIFERNPRSYNTNEDPIARIQIGRLRKKLKAYFESVGANSEIEINIPMGCYRPVIQRRIRRADSNPCNALLFAIHPFQCISEHGKGGNFAQGLHDELTHQLFKSFGNIIVSHSFFIPDSAESERRALPHTDRIAAKHRLEGSIHIDDELIRTSVRLQDISTGMLAWSEQFNREINFAIKLEEELATSICHALKGFFSR